MRIQLSSPKNPLKGSHTVYLLSGTKAPVGAPAVIREALTSIQKNQKTLHFAEGKALSTACIVEAKAKTAEQREALRNAGFGLLGWLNAQQISAVSIVNLTGDAQAALLFTEGIALGSYQFLELKSNADTLYQSLAKIAVVDSALTTNEFNRFKALVAATYLARDLVNRPFSHLTAGLLAQAIEGAGHVHGFKVEIFNKRKITTLKMGGLLAVNKGSSEEPTFTVAEYKPKNAVNKQPVVLVGKGIVYDTGGLSLKPTPNSMDFMKSDMAGAAAMIGTITAVAEMKLPVHVVALIPSTDNHVSNVAITPGDVITMSDGTTVEVKNTDAEGRLILADALVYAKKYKPELVIDAATLTGASVRAVGVYATSAMGTASDTVMRKLDSAGDATYERIIRFPLWTEYGDELKSTVADISNLGKGEAGQISAGKFLQHFTDYPWIHLDIAGPSFLHAPITYRTAGGSGVGVRLLTEFIQKHYNV